MCRSSNSIRKPPALLVRPDGSRSRGGACGPPPRKVAEQDAASVLNRRTATLWGGVGGGEIRQNAVHRSTGP